jgi:hypothetical protein
MRSSITGPVFSTSNAAACLATRWVPSSREGLLGSSVEDVVSRARARAGWALGATTVGLIDPWAHPSVSQYVRTHHIPSSLVPPNLNERWGLDAHRAAFGSSAAQTDQGLPTATAVSMGDQRCPAIGPRPPNKRTAPYLQLQLYLFQGLIHQHLNQAVQATREPNR